MECIYIITWITNFLLYLGLNLSKEKSIYLCLVKTHNSKTLIKLNTTILAQKGSIVYLKKSKQNN